MIMRKATVFAAALLFGLGTGLAANAAELDEGYLIGTWIVDSTDCSDSDAEHAIFRESGALESVRSGNLDAAGFWVINGDVVEAHVIATPAFFHGGKEDLAMFATTGDGYSAFEIRVIPFNLEQDKFDAVGLLGDEVAIGVFRRCGS